MLRITPAAGVDEAEIVALRHAAEDWLAAREIVQWTPREIPASVIRAQIAAGEFFVARFHDCRPIVGAVRLLWRDPVVWRHDDHFAGYVHSLIVDRSHAGGGIGATLVAWAERTARQAGAKVLRLDCVAANPALREYYRRLGFTEVGGRDFDNGWRSVVLFERPIRNREP